MTATCTLCGHAFNVLPDLRGKIETLRDLAGQFGRHLVKKHSKEQQTAFDPSKFPCDVPTLLFDQSVVSPTLGMGLQGLLLFTYIKCEDPAFQEHVSQTRAELVKAIEQKEAVSVVPGVQ